jgi:hypothetical protein
VRFLVLELDGRTTLDLTPQRPPGSELKRQAGKGTHRIARKPGFSRLGLASNVRYGWPSLTPA